MFGEYLALTVGAISVLGFAVFSLIDKVRTLKELHPVQEKPSLQTIQVKYNA